MSSNGRQQEIPGSLFGYEVLNLIGRGAGSTVYAATDPISRQLLALKHVTVETAKEERFVEQLEAELEVGKKVRHPGLRRSRDLKIRKSWMRKPVEALLVMDIVDGVPLDARSDWSIPRLVRVFCDAAEALHAMHSLGYVHCDMKPGNVLVTEKGPSVVIDFGQACPIGSTKQRIQGTPDFIAPEQVKRLPVTARTDVFNLGAMMYATLSGKKLPTLYTVKTSDTKFLLDSRIDSPHEINPRVPATLSALVMECVRTNTQKRPTDMTELHRRLEAIEFGLQRHPVA